MGGSGFVTLTDRRVRRVMRCAFTGFGAFGSGKECFCMRRRTFWIADKVLQPLDLLDRFGQYDVLHGKLVLKNCAFFDPRGE